MDELEMFRFKMFSGALKAMESADGRKTLRGVASSTTTDLHGDTMEQSALEDMESDANAGLTIFLNHSYNVPEDVAGSVVMAKMGVRGADQDGNPNYDLDFEIEIDDENERAVRTWKSINKPGRRSVKLGLSIGAMIPNGGAVRNKQTGAYRIAHVKLLETSIVGIPANPRSWIQNSVGCTCTKGAIDPQCKRMLDPDLIEKATTHQLGAPTLTLDAGKYRIEGSLEGLTINAWGAPDDDSTICGVQNLDLTLACGLEPHHEGVHSWDASNEIVSGIGHTDAACPDCGGSAGSPKGDCSNGMHKSLEPDVTDAKIQVITIDTDDPPPAGDSGSSSQEAPPSDPGEDDEFSAPAPDLVADAAAMLETTPGEVTLTSLQGTLDLLRSISAELVDVRRQLGEALQRNVALEQERDQAIRETGEMIAQTARIIKSVGDMPVGRKAVLRSAEQEVSQLTDRLSGGPYSADFLKMLTGGSHQ